MCDTIARAKSSMSSFRHIQFVNCFDLLCVCELNSWYVKSFANGSKNFFYSRSKAKSRGVRTSQIKHFSIPFSFEIIMRMKILSLNVIAVNRQ